MFCMGFSGGLNLIHENRYDAPPEFAHDAAAALIEDGSVVAAIEEERLDRIKHSNKFPTRAIRFCLQSRGLRLQDVDRLLFYMTEECCNSLLIKYYLDRPDVKDVVYAKALLHRLLGREFQADIDPARITFVRHHLAHAMSAFALSGFDRSLVMAIDGSGDFKSGLMAEGADRGLREIESYSHGDSLGLLYLNVICVLGYGRFDEYKVMGLAPYGEPERYRRVMRGFYDLLPDGRYVIHGERIVGSLLANIDVRKKGDPITQQHKDLAASLQEALEEMVMHVLRHHRRATGQRHLCLAGGVAHNCTLNGKICYSGLFDEVFVQPASHDAGCAVGAALLGCQETGRHIFQRLHHVYWGTDIGKESDIAEELNGWNGFLSFEKPNDVAHATAALLLQGAVVGWVQGRSEFGPRALGNRSILADPRPAANKDRINQMVKKRESYRPFAPSVLEEEAREFFELPIGMDSFPFMSVVVKVREDKRRLLGAVTHVDGTARLQTVSRETNPRFWDLIRAFKELTGVPVLLNTSFNNNVEPIVDSVRDAIVTFLTTELDYLVVGDFLVKKRRPTVREKQTLIVSLPSSVRLQRSKTVLDTQRILIHSELATSYDERLRIPVSHQLYELLMEADGKKSVGDLLAERETSAKGATLLLDDLEDLWRNRVVRLDPPLRR